MGLERALVVLCLLCLPAVAVAQDTDLEFAPDKTIHYIVLPPLIGALSFDASLVGPFPVSGRYAEGLQGLGFNISAGWRHFFTPHGEWSLRMYGLMERRPDDPMQAWGGGVALMLRGFNPRFIYGGVSAFFEAAHVSWTGMEDRTGGRGSVGLEASGGALIGGSWPMFVETGTNFSLTFGSLDGVAYWEVIGRWMIRFDISFRSDELHEPLPSQ